MSRPTKNSVMKRHVLSPKYLEYMDFAVFLLKSNIFKVILTTGLLYCVRCLYFAETIDKFREVYPDEYRSQFNDKENSELSGNQIRHLFYGKWNALETTYQYWYQTKELEHKFNFCFLLLMLSYWAIGLESSKSTLLYKFTENSLFRGVLALQLLFIVAYYALSTTVFQDSTPSVEMYYPSWRVWLSLIGALITLAVYEEQSKKHVRKLYERDHLRLQIFFKTKLGMWSPR